MAAPPRARGWRPTAASRDGARGGGQGAAPRSSRRRGAKSGDGAGAEATGQGQGVVGAVEGDLGLEAGAARADPDLRSDRGAEGLRDLVRGRLLVRVDRGAAAARAAR